MRLKILSVSIFAVLSVFAATAMAQPAEAGGAAVMHNDQFDVSFTRPEGWTVVEGNDRAIFNIKHEESQSQIEIIATQLMSADVANVFYDTFHETLEQSHFARQSVNPTDIGSHSGKLTEYTFEYAGVELKIVVFQFTHETTAYLVVGYIKADEYEALMPAFNEAVISLTFGG
jgi:hypothetical protein